MISFFDNVIIFLARNFGPLIGFYLINHFLGFKAAVIISIVLVFVEYFFLKYKKQVISSFFYFSSTIIIIFGIADLILKEPYFFKFEASLTNLFFAIFFGLSLFKEKPIVQVFAEMQNRVSTEQTSDKLFFFRFYTILWLIYFMLKSLIYLWINLNHSFDESFFIRIVIGKISFWLMMFLSVGIPKQVWMLFEKLKLFPSQRECEIFTK